MIDRSAALAEELRAFKVEIEDRLARLESTIIASKGSPVIEVVAPVTKPKAVSEEEK